MAKQVHPNTLKQLRRKRSIFDLNNAWLGWKWLRAAGWSQVDICKRLEISRTMFPRIIANPRKYITMMQIEQLCMMLPEKSYKEIFLSIVGHGRLCETWYKDTEGAFKEFLSKH